jgi:hypothetical protein
MLYCRKLQQEGAMGLPVKPTPLETALLMLRLVQSKEQEKDSPVTRFRVAEITLKRLACRQRLTTDFILDVQDALLDAGWALFFAGSTYGMIKTSAVEGWVRLGSKRIAEDLDAVARGEFDYGSVANLMTTTPSAPDD